jgi:hypothetical protein
MIGLLRVFRRHLSGAMAEGRRPENRRHDPAGWSISLARTKPRSSAAFDPSFGAKRKHMMRKTRFMVVQEAIDVLLRHLECLPVSERTEQLRADVRECIREAGLWSTSQPTDQAPDALMKRVLALHVELTKLERDMPVASAKGLRGESAN